MNASSQKNLSHFWEAPQFSAIEKAEDTWRIELSPITKSYSAGIEKHLRNISAQQTAWAVNFPSRWVGDDFIRQK